MMRAIMLQPARHVLASGTPARMQNCLSASLGDERYCDPEVTDRTVDLVGASEPCETDIADRYRAEGKDEMGEEKTEMIESTRYSRYEAPHRPLYSTARWCRQDEEEEREHQSSLKVT